MDNFLENGAVLPHGLVGVDSSDFLGAFKKTYQNVSLRVGIVVAYYDVSDIKNINKLVPEYDVLVFEQNEDKGSTTIRYQHCLSSAGFGSKADFFEAKLRQLTKKNTKGDDIVPAEQDGAIVLLLCLNGLTDTGIIISALLHPSRATTIQDDSPHLQGEYNGANILVDKDGGCTFTFKGATDSDGKVTDSSQGNTVAKIEKDGSFEINHSKIAFRLDKNGTATLTANSDINVTANGGCNITSSGKTTVRASEVDIQGSKGDVITTNTMPIIDSIFGELSQGVTTFKAG